jgi:hypothetical protein
MPERRHTQRRKFSIYMRVFDDDTQKAVGHLVDVGAIGMRLETPMPLPLAKEYHLYMELTPEISDKLFMFVTARTKWCKTDDIMPNLFHVGFEITHMALDDRETYQRLLQKYGK